METIKQHWRELKDVFSRPRHAAQQAINLGCVVFSALMLWKMLMIVTASQSPIVVVLSGSMEPGFYRGDILFLTNPSIIHSADVVVFQVDGREIPIVHRSMNIHEDVHSNFSLLTKGDNNSVDDRGLYARHQLWLEKSNIMGVAQGCLPYVGMMTIWLNDYVWLKYLTIGTMGLLVILGKE